MTDALAVVAASWGVLMALSPTLQVRRMLARRSSADVSIAYLGVLQVGFGLWVGYGFAIANPALIVPNAVAFLIGALTIVIAVRYRHPDRSSDSHAPAREPSTRAARRAITPE